LKGGKRRSKRESEKRKSAASGEEDEERGEKRWTRSAYLIGAAQDHRHGRSDSEEFHADDGGSRGKGEDRAKEDVIRAMLIILSLVVHG